jgi:hypothetical protein
VRSVDQYVLERLVTNGYKPLKANRVLMQVISGRHVNIVDLIHWARNGEMEWVQIFRTLKELSDYSYDHNKIYGRDQIGKGEVLQYLLRLISKVRSL